MIKSNDYSYNPTNFIYAFISFGIVSMRLILIILTSVLIITSKFESKIVITISILLTIALDHYDGVFFKKSALNSFAYWRIGRRLLDSITDRIIVQIGCISLLIIDSNFLIFYLIILVREIIISGYCSIQFRKNILLYPHFFAKLSSAFIGLICLFYINSYLDVATIVAASMVLFSILAFRDYQIRYNSITLKYKTKDIKELTEVF
ncbi:MAG: CDP-alcohol phosphatidyltransferase family protein [Ignavibacteriaceae bacterium]|jgi:phosphatidylglycerophosphate synthase